MCEDLASRVDQQVHMDITHREFTWLQLFAHIWKLGGSLTPLVNLTPLYAAPVLPQSPPRPALHGRLFGV
eukprot:CAMPEP_0117482166 /NCGR_PEP_ID=MMETSP0784-20121206/13279_1 /TAXON_ID=39447 /ORGANISM="" /LENGTH=69 /DNA_ID=CAMNT_0005276653 /DNA_START=756 /DNA_END=965 /DNA_ORIENTATION=+